MSLAKAVADFDREYTRGANGLDHHILEWGPADSPHCVVLCHGFLDMAYGFLALAPLLACKGYRVIAPDLRGHGETSWLPDSGYYYFPDYVLDLHALLPQLVQQPFELVGHSMGGAVATLYAATHPLQLRTLSLIEGFGPPDEPAAKAPARMLQWLDGVDAVRRTPKPTRMATLADATARLRARHPTLPEALLHKLAVRSVRTHDDGQGLTWRFDPLHRTRSPIGFDAARFGHFLANITAPTLLVQGERGLRWGDEAERLAALKNRHHAELSGAGHMMHWTHPEPLAALLLAHFKRA